MAKKKATGETQDAGFQIGVRKTLPVDVVDAWEFLTSAEGIRLWLGPDADLDFSKDQEYEMPDGTTGQVRIFKHYSHLRITWQPPEWERASTIQVRVIPTDEKTVISFHQEHLPGPQARQDRKEFFRNVIGQLSERLAKKSQKK